MELKRYQFCVNTSENCFLCLQLIPNNESNLQTPAFSLKTVLCYLKISLSELSSLSKRPPEILKRTDIKVSLCGDCETKLKTFCEQFKALELLKMKVESSFETIKRVLNEDPSELNYEEKVEGQARKHSQIVKELRQRIKNKKSWPRVVLNKIPEEAKYEEIVESVVKLEIPEESLNLDDTEEMESNPNKLDLTCKICKQLLSTPTHLKVHMRRHLLIKPFKCRYCKKSFVENWELKRHIWIHTGNGPIKCPLCPSTFADQAHFLKHKIHPGLKVRNSSSGVQSKNKKEDDKNIFKILRKECDLCKKVFTSEEELQMHVKYHRQESPFLCKKCEMDFSSKEALKAHMDQKIHKKFNLATISATEPEVLPDPLAPESPCQSPKGPGVNIQCNICGKAFYNENMFKIHSLKVHTDKNIPCSVCNEVFSSNLILKNHLKTHRQDRPFKCHLCPMAYAVKNKLCRHLRTAHGNRQRPWKCSVCGMRFLSRQNLKHHLETHQTTKLFQCKVCPSQFKHMKYLRSHFKKRHGISSKNHLVGAEPKIEPVAEFSSEVLSDPLAIPESPPHSPNGLSNLQCNVCGKAFLREEILKIHFLKVHTDKNLPCPVCNQVFPSKVILKNHLKTHQQSTSFKCHLCPMAYTLKTKLARHISTAHSAKQRPWKCSHCGMGFLTKQNLKQHLETHKGKKQFACGLCPSQFTYMKGLQFHFKMHHSRNDSTVELEPKIEVPAGAILSNGSDADILMTSTIKLS